ncbi:hypothetical protein A3C23_01750 [Candidatus Roizmanbacteria bacterium RIFCSPHIGHO2_02_FULL_37_13b]|uniref:Short-chain dehydrogenase n=1 Tax=Candidatus Roizmanbacteria bacterium RIFCSPLOWO2_02_FULL_36_11 TaxID=1802071 RepID=A0A1F7JCW8_9BACT|nr:MAG: hypothetical protein A3C23_01750 [Candidatus Roizmanbacteria bacterium RIFCSPHIGHO2_02_FULL_37_13b]OGK53460.1 MAG: hypothetical protein A3H78_02910 [Candidatus Roizmanbacteria bacterium RIFCSPLOWO2_02_FULL_36_11]
MNILITGATGGIGQEITGSLSKKHSIIALGRDKEKLKFLQKKISKNKIKIYSVDVSNLASVIKFFKEFKNSIDVLINCVGTQRPIGKFLDNDLREWKKNVEINLIGSVQMCFYSIPHLLKSKRGKIINFSGGGSAYPRAYHTAYSTSKAAVVRFTESLAQEYPELDINCISPGPHNTNIWKDEKYDEKPKKWGDVDRLKKFIDYLISSKSDGITGRFIHYKDNWEKFNPKKMSQDIYTLRRVEK